MEYILSVIVPVYNVEDYLPKCLDSIINQTYKDFEIILVDDGSTDRSGSICDEYAERDNRIIVVHKENGGAVSARKAGAKVASGQYVIQVDSDDWIDEDRIQTIVRDGLLDGKADFVYVDGIYYEDKSSFRLKTMDDELLGDYEEEIYWRNKDKLLICEGIFVDRVIEPALWAVCIRREIYLRNQIMLEDGIMRVQDVIVAFACMLESREIRYIRSTTYHYRQGREGAINSRTRSYPDYCAKMYYDNMERYLKKLSDDKRALVEDIAYKYVCTSGMLTNYSQFLLGCNDTLFPYEDIKPGSRVIVYGAGNLGLEIVNSIQTTPKFELVAWVDKYKNSNPGSDFPIVRIHQVVNDEFDYIVVAVISASVAKSIKEELLQYVDESKIKLMSSKGMTREFMKGLFG